MRFINSIKQLSKLSNFVVIKELGEAYLHVKIVVITVVARKKLYQIKIQEFQASGSFITVHIFNIKTLKHPANF